MNTSIASSYTDASNIHHVVNEFADIVPVVSGRIGERETNVVSAKALHKALGVGKDFSTWITARISEYDFTIGHDYSVNKLISPNLGKPRMARPPARFGPQVDQEKTIYSPSTWPKNSPW